MTWVLVGDYTTWGRGPGSSSVGRSSSRWIARDKDLGLLVWVGAEVWVAVPPENEGLALLVWVGAIAGW